MSAPHPGMGDPRHEHFHYPGMSTPITQQPKAALR